MSPATTKIREEWWEEKNLHMNQNEDHWGSFESSWAHQSKYHHEMLQLHDFDPLGFLTCFRKIVGLKKTFFRPIDFKTRRKCHFPNNSLGFVFPTLRRFEWPLMTPLLHSLWGSFDHLSVGPKTLTTNLAPWTIFPHSVDWPHVLTPQCNFHYIPELSLTVQFISLFGQFVGRIIRHHYSLDNKLINLSTVHYKKLYG